MHDAPTGWNRATTLIASYSAAVLGALPLNRSSARKMRPENAPEAAGARHAGLSGAEILTK